MNWHELTINPFGSIWYIKNQWWNAGNAGHRAAELPDLGWRALRRLRGKKHRRHLVKGLAKKAVEFEKPWESHHFFKAHDQLF